jgi:hypothetical protein
MQKEVCLEEARPAQRYKLVKKTLTYKSSLPVGLRVLDSAG